MIVVGDDDAENSNNENEKAIEIKKGTAEREGDASNSDGEKGSAAAVVLEASAENEKAIVPAERKFAFK